MVIMGMVNRGDPTKFIRIWNDPLCGFLFCECASRHLGMAVGRGWGFPLLLFLKKIIKKKLANALLSMPGVQNPNL